MSKLKSAAGLALSLLIAVPPGAFASSHREAPITALDHAADITDFYAFVSYDRPDCVTFIMNVDPFLQPSNGPNYFPFDPAVQYQIKIDNNQDALADITFQFRFTDHHPRSGAVYRLRGSRQRDQRAGQLAGARCARHADCASGDHFPEWRRGRRPESATDLHRVHVSRTASTSICTNITPGGTLYAVPSNAGPRTMPDYDALAASGIYSLQGPSGATGIRVFAGTVADPFFIDLGAAFDSFNFRAGAGGGVLTGTNRIRRPAQFGPEFGRRIQRQHHRNRGPH